MPTLMLNIYKVNFQLSVWWAHCASFLLVHTLWNGLSYTFIIVALGELKLKSSVSLTRDALMMEEFNQDYYCIVSKCMVVCCAAKKKQGVRKHSKYIDRNNKVMILHICSSMMHYPNGTNFTVELASTQMRPHSKFLIRSLEWYLRYVSANFCKRFFVLYFLHCHFTHFAKIAMTHVCVLQFGWSLKNIAIGS